VSLRSVRIRLTLLYTVLFAIALAVVCWIAVRAATTNIEQGAERDIEYAVATAIIDHHVGADDRPNTWYAGWGEDADEPYVEARGEAYLEPPLVDIAESARANGEDLRLVNLDGEWLIGARAVEDTEVLIAAIEYGPYRSDVGSQRLRIVAGALVALAGAALVGWWFAGRSLRPAVVALRQQRDFIADAAHELRTPLSVIQASASQALARDRPAPEYRQSLAEVRSAAERAGEGVGELLELARLDAGQAQPRLAQLRVDLLLEEVAAGIRVEGVNIRAEIGQPVVTEGDYLLLRQALENVTHNAAARSSNVVLTVSETSNDATLSVADDGPGFDAEVLHRVFDRWRRGDELGSSGLGMAIAKSIVSAHGGECSAHNRSGGGAEVLITIPKGSSGKEL
jgi:signal transduction histidine kinase